MSRVLAGRCLSQLGLLLAVSGCAVTLLQATPPPGWATAGARAHQVEHFGDWARLRGRTPRIGDYQLGDLDQSWWARAPTTSRQSVGFGDERVEAEAATIKVHNDSRYTFRLLRAADEVARVACRQQIDIRDWQLVVAGGEHDLFQVQGNESYLGVLGCSGEGWRLALQTEAGRPLHGVLRVGQESWSIIGSQLAGGAKLSETASYTVRRGDRVIGFIDRLNAGAVSSDASLNPAQEAVLVAAAAALLLAHDPVALHGALGDH